MTDKLEPHIARKAPYAVEVEAGRERGVAIVALDGGVPRREIALAWLPANPRAADFRRLAAAFARHVKAGGAASAGASEEAAPPAPSATRTAVV